MKFYKLIALSALAVFLVSGCASGTKRPGGSQITVTTEKQFVSPTNQITLATIVSSPTVVEKQKDLSENGFTQEALLERVKSELRGKNYLGSDSSKPNLTLEISLQNVRVRSTANAMLWGFMAGSDYINADVTVKDAKGQLVDKFQVETSYALGGLAGGVASVRINWLFENFSKDIVKELSGSPAKE